MQKQAFVFPGQGAQYVGMGKELSQHYYSARKTFKEADEILGFKLSNIVFNGTKEALQKAVITQPAIVTASIAAFRVLLEQGILPGAVAGLSLGEYSALVAAGAMDFEDAVLLVQKRGKYMQEAVPQGEGAMAAIMGLERKKVEELCNQGSTIGVVEAVNYNCPGQIVIAGKRKAVEETCKIAREAGAKKVITLAVSVPFHCRLLQSVEKKMAQELKKIKLSPPSTPFVANYNASYLYEPQEIKKALIKQVSNPVYWEDSMRLLLADGYSRFIEVGPGKTLSSFIKKISSKTWTAQIDNYSSLQKLVEQFGEVKIS